jgi:Protein of unknown function (DUF3306)
VSEPESFLTRWSRRKREADDVAPAGEPEGDSTHSRASENLDPPSGPAEPSTPTAQGENANDDPLRTKEPGLSAVDLSALPSLESITATTDIRPFLMPGVPVELSRAALRRAWLADPAIRDFVGLAENAWDFTAPEAVPGFGASVPAEIARELVARILGEDRSTPPPPSADQGEMVKNPNVSAQDKRRVGHGTDPKDTTADSADSAGGPAGESGAVDIAMHKEEAAPEKPAGGRRHGGALPR